MTTWKKAHREVLDVLRKNIRFEGKEDVHFLTKSSNFGPIRSFWNRSVFKCHAYAAENMEN